MEIRRDDDIKRLAEEIEDEAKDDNVKKTKKRKMFTSILEAFKVKMEK